MRLSDLLGGFQQHLSTDTLSYVVSSGYDVQTSYAGNDWTCKVCRRPAIPFSRFCAKHFRRKNRWK